MYRFIYEQIHISLKLSSLITTVIHDCTDISMGTLLRTGLYSMRPMTAGTASDCQYQDDYLKCFPYKTGKQTIGYNQCTAKFTLLIAMKHF